jgi:bifunctional non-homologous end joining protein LigD
VVGGYRPDGAGFDSILVGYYEGERLYHAGKVRAGFTPHTRRDLFKRIQPHAIQACPFVDLPNVTGKTHWGEGITAEEMLELRWVEPRVVVVVSFTEWTEGGSLRHAAFVGLRDDKPPRDVHRS